MTRARGLWCAGLFLAVGVATCVAAQPAALPLTESQKAHLKSDAFQVITSIRGLPLGVRDSLGALINGQYTDFAEPDTPFRPADPRRRLSLAACAADHHCLVYYERGGPAHTWHVAVFRWTPDATTLEFGGGAPGRLKTIDAVRGAILSGAVKTAPVSW